MKILIICSKQFYGLIPKMKKRLEEKGNEVFLPNCFDNPGAEEEVRSLGREEHSKFKAKMFAKSEKTISEMDAVLVLNYEKHGQKNYVGGATFLEMYDAFRLGKKIFMINDIPEGILKDEIIGFAPKILHGDIENLF